MSTFMFKNKSLGYTPVNNVFIDKYMANARGEYVKVYLLGLKYCISGELGANSAVIANTLSLLESDILNAWNYWSDMGVVKMCAIDNMGNYTIEFIDLDDSVDSPPKNFNILKELDNSSIKDMLQDIEKLIGRTISPKEIEVYLSWQKDFNFSPELILLLIQYCVSKGKNDYRYFEKIAIAWHDDNIKTIEDAQMFIKRHEDKWINIRKILKYLGINSPDVMKPQEDMIYKWFSTYKFNADVIYKACDICFERLNRADFKYIDGILNSWFKSNITSLEDVEKKDRKKLNHKPIMNSSNKNKDSFNNFEQRSYNFEELEKDLLGWYDND
ncbi:DnaD domain protein [Clostridium ihumii]|uniref:DnaD domain protein n=1 Tax=Clostridium ihumii TaxID=1470356 RepID=UPI00054F82E0|nr:DnaD domain protein [Clostridium ihumii]